MIERRHTGWLCMLLAGVGTAADPPPQPSASLMEPASLEEVLVTGERPGPGMWRVSKASHDLWILATLEPLPKKVIWRSDAVEARIAASQIVLSPPEVSTNIGFFRGLTLLPSLWHARKSPDGQTLEQALPHDLYIRWLALRVKYLGRDGDEQIRPLIAAMDLYLHALDQSGLASDEMVWEEIQKIARKDHVTVIPVTAQLTLNDPKAAIRDLAQISHSAEIDCLEKTVTRLETDLQPMRQRANLWSLGNVEGLRAMPVPDEQTACLNAFFSVPALRDQLRQVRTQLDAAWLAAADLALDNHASSFAVVSLGELLKPDGYLAQLREHGYVVTEP